MRMAMQSMGNLTMSSSIGLMLFGVVWFCSSTVPALGGNQDLKCSEDHNAYICAAHESKFNMILLGIGNDEDKSRLVRIVDQLISAGRNVKLKFFSDPDDRGVLIFADGGAVGQIDFVSGDYTKELLSALEKVHDTYFPQ